MYTLVQDIRFAARSLARSPGFAAVALLTIALGVGANAAMFSIVDGVLLRPLPYDRPEQLARLYQASPEQGLLQTSISALDFEDWQERSRSFQSTSAYWKWQQTLSGDGEAVELETAWVTDGFFSLLGVPVELGRPLMEGDFRRAERNVVISHDLWRTRFGGEVGVVGSTVTLNDETFTIVGVARASFNYPTSDTDAWLPHSLLTEDLIPRFRQVRYLEAVGRLRDGVTPTEAQAELSAIAAQLAAEHPGSNRGWDAATVVPLRSSIVGEINQTLIVLLGVVGFILLIGCVNLANLLLARGSARSQELAVRSALGASRARLVRQLGTESAVLAVVGGALGLLLASWCLEAVLALSAQTLPRVEAIRLDGRVVAFTLAISAVAALSFGLLPALRSARRASMTELRSSRGTLGREDHGLRSGLVVAEVTLAAVLVIGSGLMIRSFLELRSVDPGFDPDGVLAVSLSLPVPTGAAAEDLIAHLLSRREAIVERVRGIPGVVAVGSIQTLPLQGGGEPLDLRRTDQGGAPDGAEVRTDLRYVNHDYFRAMGIRLIEGPGLSDELAPGGRLPILVSGATARRFWPGEDAVGQVVLSSLFGEMVVTGVVGDVRQRGLAEEPTAAAYLSDTFAARATVDLVIRADRSSLALAESVRDAIRQVDPNQPIRSIAPLSLLVRESVAQDRFLTLLFSLFGTLGLGMAALGTYGVLAYSVGQRTSEIGLRIALGADAHDVLGLVVKHGMLLVGAGLAIGTAIALLATRLLQARLYGISALDPAAFIAALAILASAGFLASYLPARRALRVDPMTALRAD
jgi:putative ABC transport system permease protein